MSTRLKTNREFLVEEGRVSQDKRGGGLLLEMIDWNDEKDIDLFSKQHFESELTRLDEVNEDKSIWMNYFIRLWNENPKNEKTEMYFE